MLDEKTLAGLKSLCNVYKTGFSEFKYSAPLNVLPCAFIVLIFQKAGYVVCLTIISVIRPCELPGILKRSG